MDIFAIVGLGSILGHGTEILQIVQECQRREKKGNQHKSALTGFCMSIPFHCIFWRICSRVQLLGHMVAVCVAFLFVCFLGSHLPPTPPPGLGVGGGKLPHCFVEWLHNFAFLLAAYEEVSFSAFTPLGVATVFNFSHSDRYGVFTLAALGLCC